MIDMSARMLPSKPMSPELKAAFGSISPFDIATLSAYDMDSVASGSSASPRVDELMRPSVNATRAGPWEGVPDGALKRMLPCGPPVVCRPDTAKVVGFIAAVIWTPPPGLAHASPVITALPSPREMKRPKPALRISAGSGEN